MDREARSNATPKKKPAPKAVRRPRPTIKTGLKAGLPRPYEEGQHNETFV